ncbi:MAG: DMT family transporter [Thermoplasmatota archaeon]
MLAVVAFWGGAFAAIKLALDAGLSPLELTLTRFAVSAPFFIVALLLLGRPRFERADWWRVALIAFLSVAGYHLALNFGETQVAAGTAAILVATGPIWTALVSSLLIGERLGAWKLVGLGVALAGAVVLVLGRGDAITLPYLAGALVALAAPIMWAFSSVLSKPLVVKTDPIPFSAATTLLGTLFIVPLIPFANPAHVLALPRAAWLAVLFLGIIATVWGYVGFNIALRELTATETMAYVYLNPVFGVFWSYLFIRERITLGLLAGGALVILGVALAQIRSVNAARLAGGPARE